MHALKTRFRIEINHLTHLHPSRETQLNSKETTNAHNAIRDFLQVIIKVIMQMKLV